MTKPAVLPRKPEARTEKVEDLVERVRRGLIRIPDPLVIPAPQIPDAWWVVDGQQRLAAFSACLLRDLPLPEKPEAGDPFVLYFDAISRSFEGPPAVGEVPTHWVPVPHLLNGSRLSEWIFGWQHRDDQALRTAVFEAGARIREYPIPLYLIEGADWKAAREIFTRTNLSGVPLEWKEIHKALFAGEGEAPATLEELAEELEHVGMGRLGEERLLTCLMSLRRLDPTRSLAEHRRRDESCLDGAVQEAVPVLRRVLSFLRADAGIPHLRLLPMSVLLDILTRFFAVHPEPKPRTRILLARWYWRTVLGAGAFDERTLRRRGIVAIDGSEEQSVQRLLGLLHPQRPRPLDLPIAFDARSDDNRIVLLTLVHLRPRTLLGGEPLDVPTLLEAEGKDAFLKIVKDPATEVGRGPANRIIQPKGTAARRLLRHLASLHRDADPILASHAIDRPAADALEAGDDDSFLARRQTTLAAEVRCFTDRRAAWDANDRPSVDFLLHEAGVAL